MYFLTPYLSTVLVKTDSDLSAEPQQFIQQIGHFVCLVPLDRQSSISLGWMLSTAIFFSKALDLLDKHSMQLDKAIW